MPFLASLLKIQDLDLSAGRARTRSETLSERERLPQLATLLVQIDARLVAARADRVEQEAEEEELGREVSQIAKDIEAAEIERYSGKRKDQDEAAAHTESQHLLREKQVSLEERELALLEAIESVDERIGEEDSARAANLADSEKFTEVIRRIEAEVSAELEQLALDRQKIAPEVPEKILAAYDRVRDQARMGGRGAASLAEGRCSACRIKLPSLEKTRMLAEPEDALIQCPQCRRVLVR